MSNLNIQDLSTFEELSIEEVNQFGGCQVVVGQNENIESALRRCRSSIFLEDHQFSTNTKLKGEVIFAFGNSFGFSSFAGSRFSAINAAIDTIQ